MLEKRYTGRIIAAGVGVGHAHVERAMPVGTARRRVPEGALEAEVARLDAAVSRVRRHLDEHVRVFHSTTEEDVEQIVGAHRSMLDDRHFFDEIARRVRTERMSAERAVQEAFTRVATRLATSGDPYLAARAEDLRDLCQLIAEALLFGDAAFSALQPGCGPIVFVLNHLHPSAVMRAHRAGAAAVVTSSTAWSAHGGILLRAFGIPSIGAIPTTDEAFRPGVTLLVDADEGTLVVEPTEQTLRRAVGRARPPLTVAVDRTRPPRDAIMCDGSVVRLWANIDDPAQASGVFTQEVRGIGLFRTETLMLAAGRVPTEAEQLAAYRQAVEGVGDRLLVLRTFDVGAEKVIDGIQDDTDINPALGVRGLRRHLLRVPEELRTQLRAVLVATAGANAAILLPMVTHAEDVVRARAHLDAVRAQLDEEGVVYNTSLKVAAMIEVPAAAFSVREILAEVDFVSVGTNDMVQYLSAADRDNPAVLPYLDPVRSGLFRLLAWVLAEAREVGRAESVLVGGEVASDPASAARLVRLGVRGLIVHPGAVQAVRAAIEKE